EPRETPGHPVTQGEVRGQLQPPLAHDLAVEVPLVGDIAEQVEGADGDARRDEGLGGELAVEAAALGAAWKRELEAGGHQRAVLDRLPEEELVLDREAAESGRGGRVPRV